MSHWRTWLGALLGVLVGTSAIVALILLVRRWKPELRGSNDTRRAQFPLRRFVPLFTALWFTRRFELQSPLGVCLVVATALGLLLVEIPLTYVFVPLGMVRTTYALMRLAKHSTRHVSSQVGPAFWAALALLRKPNEGGARFIEARLAACSELSALGSAALALVALSRGERERAHGIFRGLRATPFGVLSRELTHTIYEFFVLEAAARGDWRMVSDWADYRPRSRLTWLLSGIAQRAQFEPRAPSRPKLWLRWCCAPKRRLTWSLVRRATLRSLTQLEQPTYSKQPAHSTQPKQPIAPDLSAQAALARRLPADVRARDVAAAVLSLDALRTSEEMRAVCAEAETDLADALLEAHLPAAWLPAGATGEAVRARVRDGRLARVERLTHELARRTDQHQDLDELGEWQAFGDLAGACDEFLRDAIVPADYEVLFRMVHRALWNFGYRQGFEKGRRLLAHCVFRRQLELSDAAKAQDTRATIMRNVAASALHAAARNEQLEGERLYDRSRLAKARKVMNVLLLCAAAPVTLVLMSANRFPHAVLPGILVALPFVVLFAELGRRLVEVVQTADGVVVQTLLHRHLAERRDITLRAGPRGAVWIELARSPHWLPRKLWTFQSSPEAARAVAARFMGGDPL